MRKRFLILFLLVSAVVYGQTPAGYIKANMRFKWTAGIFDSALHVPQYSGTPSGTRNGAWVGDGAIGMDTTNHRMYIYSGGAWLRLASYAEAMNSWSLTGNAGTNTSTNFIGTTDAQPLMFRYNNLNAGSIGKSTGGTYLGIGAGENDNAENEPNVGVGYYALYYNTTGSANSAVGASALASNTTGSRNSAVGVDALSSNTTGDDNSAVGGFVLGTNTTGYYNSAVGVSALYSNTTGSYNSVVGVAALASNTTGDYNSAVGNSAGWNIKQKPDAKYQTLLGSSTYGTRDSITVLGADFIKETIVRGKLIDSTLSAGSGTKAVRWNSSTGEFTYADTTAGGATPAGSNKQVQYNNSGAFGGATGVEIGNTNERLTVTSQATSEAALTVKQVGGYVGLNIKPSDASTPYSPLLSFSQTINSVSAKMGLDGGVFRIEGCLNPYGFQNEQEVAFGSFYSGLANFRVHTYIADVPASPDDWTIRVRTPKTAAVGQVIDWGAAGQTGDLLQFRKNDNTVLSRFDSVGNLGLGVAPTTKLDVGGTFAARQGADVASANNLAVVANSTEITGTTQVNLIANTGWVNGSQITLLLASGITIKNGQTTSGSNITILLDGAADFVTSAASSLTLLLCEVGGTQAWREISRRSY